MFIVAWSPAFVLGLPPRTGFFENSPSDHEPFDVMQALHPPCPHVLHWSLKRSANRTWTSSAFSINESAWSGRITCLILVCEVALEVAKLSHQSPPICHKNSNSKLNSFWLSLCVVWYVEGMGYRINLQYLHNIIQIHNNVLWDCNSHTATINSVWKLQQQNLTNTLYSSHYSPHEHGISSHS